MIVRVLIVVCLACVFALAACAGGAGGAGGGGGGGGASPIDAAASVAQWAIDAAAAEAARPDATRQTIIDAGLAAAIVRATDVAPAIIGDPAWADAIRSAIGLAVVLAKSDGTATVNRADGLERCREATVAAMSRARG